MAARDRCRQRRHQLLLQEILPQQMDVDGFQQAAGAGLPRPHPGAEAQHPRRMVDVDG